MPETVIPAPAAPAIPTACGRAFPVRRVYCVGRNYADHAREMGHDPDREPPFFFQKNADDLDPSGTFPYPPRSRDVHHEVELAVALGGGGRDVAAADALGLVWGYAVALDMTRRDLQGEAKAAGRPWEAGKAFERSAPIGPIHAAADVGHLARGRIALSVDGALRQEGDLAALIWPVPAIVAALSTLFVLAPGDVILTGTPAGVGSVARGQAMLAEIEGLGSLAVRVA